MKTQDKIKRVEVRNRDVVTYISGSGKRYEAHVVKPLEYVKENMLPQVSLIFFNERGKVVRKPHVCPENPTMSRQVYSIADDPQKWRKRIFYERPR